MSIVPYNQGVSNFLNYNTVRFGENLLNTASRMFRRSIRDRPSRALSLGRRAGPQQRMRRNNALNARRALKSSQFNAGYTIVNAKAINSKRRRRRGRRSRIVKKRKTVRRLGKVAALLNETVTKNIVQMNEIENSRGKVLMPNMSRSSDSTLWLPLHLIDITNVDHNDVPVAVKQLLHIQPSVPGTIAPEYVFTNTVFTKDTSEGEIASDTYTGTSIPMGYTSTALGGLDRRKWFMHNMKMDLMMYGQKDQDTMYRIDIVRFHPKFVQWIEDGMISGENTGNIENSPHQGDWKTFWHSLTTPYVQNPLYKQKRGNFMKILKSFKFKIPEQSTSFAALPCVKTRISHYVNKVVNRYWHHPTEPLGYVEANNPENAAPMTDTKVDAMDAEAWGNGKIDPRWRTYVMIRATNTDNRALVSNSIEVTKGQEPTYDIRLSTKFSVNP